MKIKSAESASLIIAAAVTLFSVGGAVIDYLVADGPWEWYYISYSSGVFIGTYFVSRWVIRKFTLYRIKPIYQVAISRHVKTHDLEDKLINKENMLDIIEEQVASWADIDLQEIEKLKASERFRREFLGNVSHELKTPIFNIQGYITTLLDGALDDEAVNRTYLERAEKNTDRLIYIISELDVINRLETMQIQLKFQDYDLVEQVNYIFETLGYEAAERGIRLSQGKANQEPVIVRADKMYIEQVFTNLISNSIHYGKQGGHTHISYVDMFDRIMVEVTDDGIGISSDDITHIFERFYRVDKSRSRKQGGTGLGLAIVKHIINSHKEGIAVRSEPGEGTTFGFTLAKGADPAS